MSTDQPVPRAHRVVIDACLELGVPFWWRSPATLLIEGAGVAPVLRALEAAGERIIGLEGFELESVVIHPRIDLIYDAGVRSPRGIGAVADWGTDVWVDVTLADRR